MIAGTLELQMFANMARLSDDMHKARQTVGTAMQSMNRSIDVVKGALGALGLALGMRELVEFGKHAMENADHMGKMAQSAGVSIEVFSRYSVAARLGDVSNEAFAQGLGKLGKSISDANYGLSTQARAFATLGINIRDQNGNLKGAADIMREMSDRFSKMPDGAAKTGAAMDLMGKSGAALIPALDDGAAKFDELGRMADQMGITLDQGTVSAIQEVNDRMNLAGMATEGLGNLITKALLPTLDMLSKMFYDTATDGETMRTTAHAIALAFKGVVTIGLNTVYIFKEAGKGLVALGEAAAAALHGNFKAAKAIMREQHEDAAKDAKTFADRIGRIWSDSTESVKSATKLHRGARSPSSHSFFSPADLAAQSNILNGMKGSFDQYVRAQQEGMQIMSASNRALVQEYDKIAATETKAQQAAQKIFIAGRMTATAYHDTLAKITAEAEHQRAVAKQLQEQQDKLNSSWSFGAKGAMQTYVDAAKNTAAQSTKVFGDMFKGMEDALVSFVQTGKLDFSSLADSIIADLIRIQIQKGIASLFGGKTGAMASLFGSANGNAFGGNGVQTFAQGGAFTNGIFASPTMFRFANGGGFSTGVMGEAGPEAVMPLKRGSDGKLGVSGGGATHITFAPVYHIDSRADRAQVQQDMQRISRESNAELVDRLHREGAL